MKEKKFWTMPTISSSTRGSGGRKPTADLLQFTFQIRKYDVVPDVMIYSNRFPPKLSQRAPAHRRCRRKSLRDRRLPAAGDLLHRRRLATRHRQRQAVPRPNGRYLAEQWPDEAEPAAATQSIWPYVIAGVLVLAIVFWGLVEIIRRLIMWLWRLLAPQDGRHRVARAACACARGSSRQARRRDA